MKAYLFIPNPGYYPPDKVIAQTQANGRVETIEIPEGAIEFGYWFREIREGEEAQQWSAARYFPLPRPKKKVKKWQWEFVGHGVVWRTLTHLSENEFGEQYMAGHKVEETLIEEEAT